MTRFAPLLILLAGPALAQECYFIPTQCGPGGCCPPGYYYGPPRPRVRPQPQYSPPVGSPGTPKFDPDAPLDNEQPKTPPPQSKPPAPPLPPQWSMSEQDWLDWRNEQKQANADLLAAVKGIPTCECEPCNCDLSGVEKKLDAIYHAVTAPRPEPTPQPAPQPTPEQHVVVVADRQASWWPRLSGEIEKTEDTYHGIAIAPLPDFPIGEIPQAVVYENRVPVRVVRGLNEVLDLLSHLRRGDKV